MIVALTDIETITFGVIGLFLGLALIALLRVVFRKEPSPPTWKRIRIGFFIERDPKRGDDDT